MLCSKRGLSCLCSSFHSLLLKETSNRTSNEQQIAYWLESTRPTAIVQIKNAYESELDASLHVAILTLVHRDASTELDKLLSKLRNQTSRHSKNLEVKESTLFTRYAQRTLLHIASCNGAKECVKLLLNEPYCWRPDHLDGRNMTPMFLAEMRDDIAVLLELAKHSNEERVIDTLPVRPPFGGLVSTLLLWPQDLRSWKMTLEAIVKPRCVGISGSADDLEGHYVYRTCMIGPLVALCFELYLSNPSLFDFDLWMGNFGSKIREKDGVFAWPISENYVSTDCRYHLQECTEYPHCLYRLGLANLHQKKSLTDSLKALRDRWIVHRFGKLDYKRDNGQIAFGCLRLSDLCRLTIRRILVRRMVNGETETHYVHLINNLRQPQHLERFLLYYDIWCVSEWENQLADGHGGNVPYGTRLIAKPTKNKNGRAGVAIGNRFIPTSNPD
ncbi:unnamed protein product [Dicrocoelium dendriticum]|nr:unnamed protein product [Dicrocoelium dendriticum]